MNGEDDVRAALGERLIDVARAAHAALRSDPSMLRPPAKRAE